jgi:hypothetical protein
MTREDFSQGIGLCQLGNLPQLRSDQEHNGRCKQHLLGQQCGCPPKCMCWLQAKWGPRQEGQGDCKIEVDELITGNPALPQKPFGNLAYLQRFWVQEDPYYEMVPALASAPSDGKNVYFVLCSIACPGNACLGST